MVLGDVQAWLGHFISIDERLLQRIAVVWPCCLAGLGNQPEEDAITINLVDRLCKDEEVRRICHWIEYQHEPFGLGKTGAKFSKGKIDMAVLLDWERDRYLAYECKRLNVVHGGKRSSLAGAYVAEGMMRFMTEQYAEALPVGCMLGYVMDGDIAFAAGQLSQAISNHTALSLTNGPAKLPMIQSVERFQTGHARQSKRPIELRHALLVYKAGSSATS